VEFSIVHTDFYFLFFCWSPLSVVLTVARGQQATRYRFDAYVFAATGDVAWVQLYVRIVSCWGKTQPIKKGCSNLVKLSKNFRLSVMKSIFCPLGASRFSRVPKLPDITCIDIIIMPMSFTENFRSERFLLNITQTQFDVFLTVHHCIDLFQLPN
jgi:hypothetical protein